MYDLSTLSVISRSTCRRHLLLSNLHSIYGSAFFRSKRFRLFGLPSPEFIDPLIRLTCVSTQASWDNTLWCCKHEVVAIIHPVHEVSARGDFIHDPCIILYCICDPVQALDWFTIWYHSILRARIHYDPTVHAHGSMIGYMFHNAFSMSDRGGLQKSMLFKVGK